MIWIRATQARRAQSVALAVVVVAVGIKPLAAQNSEPCSLLCLSAQAREALNTRKYPDYLRLAREVAARAPNHPGGIYAVARGYALLGQQDSAIAWLNRLADIGAAEELGSDSAFATLRSMPSYATVEKRLQLNGSQVIRGRAAFSIPDSDLVPEALTWDPWRRRWLIGSLAKNKVVSRAANGTWADFLTGRPDILRVVGIHADSARHLLWFATWEPTGEPGRFARTRLFKSDLATGRVRSTYEPADTGISHLLNDMAIASNGDVYITDSHAGVLYRVTAAGDSLEAFMRPDPTRLSVPNGIALSGDERTLYVAFIEGIAKVDLASREATLVASPNDVSTSGIDGLYWYSGDLIAVQNARGLERVIRLNLDASGDDIVGAEILERSRDLLRVPTTGAIRGSRFFYIANSQADRLSNDNTLRPAPMSPAPLTTVRVVDLTSRNSMIAEQFWSA